MARGLALLAVVATGAWAVDVPACPAATADLRSGHGPGKYTVHFVSEVDVELDLLWVDDKGEEHSQGTILPWSDTTRDSFEGHAFRVREHGGARSVLREVTMRGPKKKIHVKVAACGAVAEAMRGAPPPSPRAAEFEALLHALDAPCVGPSSNWSCVRYLGEADLRARDPRAYGIQPGETSEGRWFTTVDHTYVSQIPRIPRVSPGPGYAKLGFTAPMRAALADWYALRRNDSMIAHGTIPGGYTNNDHVLIDKVNLDQFPKTHGAVLREMREILQWWTGLRLKHTSTFGVRIYRRGSTLIDHVDRMDTHLASAVIQIDQAVDRDGGWPLELLLPDKTVAEVYTQPGEIILYEGAWLRHGRPMRFRGDEFANVFSHFSPLDWGGPREADAASRYYGVPDNRQTTVADSGYRKSTDYAPLDGAAAPPNPPHHPPTPPRRKPRGGAFDFGGADPDAAHGEL